MKILNNWLNYIPNKKILDIKLNKILSKTYNLLTELNYIIVFDIEFLRYKIKREQVMTIHEMGGIILYKKNDEWFLYCFFHFNLKPLIKNIKQYYLLVSTTNTVSEKTYKQLFENEQKLLPEFNPDSIFIKMYKIKKIEKIKYMINGYDLKKHKIEYKLFEQNINLILNDPLVRSREINKNDEINFINLTNKLFSISYLIVKGLEDLKAIKNHTRLLNQSHIKLINYYDIAKHNDFLYKKCDSAQLEKTYFCIEKMDKIKPYINFIEYLETFTEIKAHNPLIDAYYTWIIFNIFVLKEL